MGKVILTGKGRRWYLRGHPWIYKDDVATGDATPGELVPVEDPNGAPLGWGLFSSQSRIRVRMVTREAEQPNRAFWAERMQQGGAADAHTVAAAEQHLPAAFFKSTCRLLAQGQGPDHGASGN